MDTHSTNNIRTFNGQVIIIKPDKDASMSELTNNVIEFTTDNISNVIYKIGLKSVLLVDMSAFSVASSTFFGTLGATIQIPHIVTVGLCGMRGMVYKTAERFGIVDGSLGVNGNSEEIVNNAQKLKVYDNLEKALESLVEVLEVQQSVGGRV